MPDKWKPPFMRWWENDFWSHNVRKMKALARLMYRSLLQASWHSDNPPYVPNIDADLMLMADAPSAEDWSAHRETILQRFQQTDDGQWLYHPKALQEYERALSEHQRKGDGVRRRWEGVTNSHPEPTAPASVEKARRATQIPADFSITDPHRKLAAELGIDADAELPQFRDFHKAKGNAMKDWNAAFNTWLRNAQKFGKGTAAAKPTRMVNPADLVREELQTK